MVAYSARFKELNYTFGSDLLQSTMLIVNTKYLLIEVAGLHVKFECYLHVTTFLVIRM